jgi:hypothetical protein
MGRHLRREVYQLSDSELWRMGDYRAFAYHPDLLAPQVVDGKRAEPAALEREFIRRAIRAQPVALLLSGRHPRRKGNKRARAGRPSERPLIPLEAEQPAPCIPFTAQTCVAQHAQTRLELLLEARLAELHREPQPAAA